MPRLLTKVLVHLVYNTKNHTPWLRMFKYIEVFYNRQRLHQMLDYKPLQQFEAENAPASSA